MFHKIFTSNAYINNFGIRANRRATATSSASGSASHRYAGTGSNQYFALPSPSNTISTAAVQSADTCSRNCVSPNGASSAARRD